MRKRRYCLNFLFIFLLFCSCSKPKDDVSVVPETPVATETVEEQPLPQNQNAFELDTGFIRYDKVKDEGITLLALLEDGAKMAEKHFSLKEVYPVSDTQAVIYYSFYTYFDSREQYNEGSDELEKNYDGWEEEFTEERYLALCDLNTGILKEPVALPEGEEGSSSYLEYNGMLWNWNLGTENNHATGYNANLQVVRDFTVPSNSAGYIAPDGQYYYYIENHTLMRLSISGEAEPEEITLDMEFLVRQLYGIYGTASGEICGIISGLAGDFQEYTAVVSLDRGTFLYIGTDVPGTIYTQNGKLINNRTWVEGSTGANYTVYDGLTPFTYTFADNEYASPILMGEGLLLFSDLEIEDESTEEEEYGEAGGIFKDLNLWLFDASSGEKLSSIILETDLSFANVYQAVPYPGEDALLLWITGQAAETEEAYSSFYRWDYKKGKQELVDPVISEAKKTTGLLGQISTTQDMNQFVPGECPEELADLRAEADRLEKEFGIELKISKECSDIYGGYAIVAVSDRDIITESLKEIETELLKYPDDFFYQFAWDGIDGIEIYVAGTLIGVSEEVLDTAGGMATTKNNRMLLAIDCTIPGNIATTLHHEIAHGIDNKLQSDYENNYLDETAWDALNPWPDIYRFTYSEYENTDLYEYTYMSGCDEEIYFIDNYSMTFPTEDRARIFEYAMIDGFDGLWDLHPHVREKLNFYAECIRAGFDTEGWQDVRWERYMKK